MISQQSIHSFAIVKDSVLEGAVDFSVFERHDTSMDAMFVQELQQDQEQQSAVNTIAPELARDLENRRLLKQWLDGDETAKDKLIRNNLGLIQRISAQKARKYNRDEGEFLALAYETMVRALDDLYFSGHTNVGGYLTTAIRRAIDKAVRKERSRKEVSLEVAFPVGKEPTVDFYSLLETWEELYASCETEKDKRIIEFKSQGYNLEETAGRVGMPRSTVQYRLKLILQRYDERQAALR